MLFAFVVDTSASMNQRSYKGLTLLDYAKASIDHFLKLRQREPAARNDRYILLSTPSDPHANPIQSGLSDPLSVFSTKFKGLRALDHQTSVAPALTRAFEVLSSLSINTDADRFGQGLHPWLIHPGTVVLLTDGGSAQVTVETLRQYQRLKTPFCSDPFRWEQRLFTMVLQCCGTYGSNTSRKRQANRHIAVLRKTPAPRDLYSQLCNETGGACYVVFAQRVIPTMKTLVQASTEQVGVVIKLLDDMSAEGVDNGSKHEDTPTGDVVPSTPTPGGPEEAAGTRGGGGKRGRDRGSKEEGELPTLLYVRRNVGNWPLPEAYVHLVASRLPPPRRAVPTFYYSRTRRPVKSNDRIVPDIYQLNATSKVSLWLLGKGSADFCWYVYVQGPEVADRKPCGYIRANTELNACLLHVMPYDFPTLFAIHDEFIRVNGMVSNELKQRAEAYFDSVPSYYIPPLKVMLKRHHMSALLSESLHSDMGQSANLDLDSAVSSHAETPVSQEMATWRNEHRSLEATLTQKAEENTVPSHYYGYTGGSVSGRGSTRHDHLQRYQRKTRGDVGQIGLAAHSFDFLEGVPTGHSGGRSDDEHGRERAGSAGGHVPLLEVDKQAVFSAISHFKEDLFSREAPPTNMIPNVGPVYTNPFDIPRGLVLDQFVKLRAAVLGRTPASSAAVSGATGTQGQSVTVVSQRRAVAAHSDLDGRRFSLPIAVMGDFEDTLMRLEIPRDPQSDNPEEDRVKWMRGIFGNPYRSVPKKGTADTNGTNEVVDEADAEALAVAGVEPVPQQGSRRRHRSRSLPPPPPAPPSDSSPAPGAGVAGTGGSAEGKASYSRRGTGAGQTADPTPKESSRKRPRESDHDRLATTGHADASDDHVSDESNGSSLSSDSAVSPASSPYLPPGSATTDALDLVLPASMQAHRGATKNTGIGEPRRTLAHEQQLSLDANDIGALVKFKQSLFRLARNRGSNEQIRARLESVRVDAVHRRALERDLQVHCGYQPTGKRKRPRSSGGGKTT